MYTTSSNEQDPMADPVYHVEILPYSFASPPNKPPPTSSPQ